MPCVDCGHVKAQMQGGCSDHEVREVDGDAAGGLLALDSSGKLSDEQRERMHDHVPGQFFDEFCAPHTIGIGFGPVDAVRQFDDADDRKRTFRIAAGDANTLDDLFDGLLAPFARDQYGGIEDQSYAEVSRGLRLATISSRSAANPASIAGSRLVSLA